MGTRNDIADPMLSRIDNALFAGQALKQWTLSLNEQSWKTRTFPLIRTFNGADTSFGFFDEVKLGNADVPVMGEIEDRQFDHSKCLTMDTLNEELREFTLKYLMRVSDFRRPHASTRERPRRGWLPEALSLCPQTDGGREGFGYSQLWFKLRSDGTIGRFPREERFRIIDMRDLFETYQWVVLRIRIFDFSVTLNPLGNKNPQITAPLEESSFVVLSSDFIDDQNKPEVDASGRTIIGRYGFGYAFVKGSDELLSYGPGQFDAAFQEIQFRMYEDGETRVKLVFVANRPKHITNISIAPLSWAASLANTVTLGIAASFIDSLQPTLNRFPFRLGTIDPISLGVNVANLATGNQAARQLCISREQLEKTFLVKHFDQHYEMINGALQTWREIPDWTNEASLPEWVKTGVSS